MSDPGNVMRRWFEEVWNQGREAAVDELMAADAVAHGLSPQPLVGTAAFKPFYAAFRQAFPDLRIEVVRTLTDGDFTSVQIRTTGLHTGDGLGTAATRQPVDFGGMLIARIRDGKIAEGWNCIDFLTMYQQLGLVRNPIV